MTTQNGEQPPLGAAGEEEFDAAFEAALQAKQAPEGAGATEDNAEAASEAGQDDPAPDAAEAAPEDQPEAQPAETDLWATATPAQRAAYEAERKRVEALEHADRSNRGRLSTLQRQVNDLLSANGGKMPDAAPKGAARVKALLDSDAVKQAVADYGEANAPLVEVLQAQAEALEAFEARSAADEQERTQAYLAEQAKIVAEALPDYGSVAKSEAFLDWYRRSPDKIREMVERNAVRIEDGREVVAVVRLFKAETAAADPEPNPNPNPQNTLRSRQLSGSSAVPNRGQGQGASAPDDFDAAFDHYAKRKSVSAR